ncbi:TetR/AcrR family transcriptional regulator [Demequina capsici]|uniref:TetR family transcriptional regulator n=1 Tax=Demequina capsici TaxID=3075620 RepID=A0AA96F6V8_9MICO|nr:TetR family transcriptional regulator [Demequina sp. OYTSA14]WNM24699.1 TetR family transcriptional regulator [Demequina sp. OYTSA14]
MDDAVAGATDDAPAGQSRAGATHGRHPAQPEPASARDQIRACALRLFAERGVAGTSVRDIATCAGTSPANVLHHFGSKEGLRDAIDEEVARMFDLAAASPLEDLADALAAEQGSGSFAELLLSVVPPDSPVPAYVRRLLLDGGDAGRRLFRGWFQAARTMQEGLVAAGVAKEAADPDARTAFLLVNDLAMILLREHVADAIGTDPLTPEGAARWTADALDVYGNGAFNVPPSPA